VDNSYDNVSQCACSCSRGYRRRCECGGSAVRHAALNDGLAVSEYTVENLQPSNDAVNVPVTGRLYEATVTVDAEQGTVTPAIRFFNARADNGQNYRVLFQAPSPRASAE
jgi:Domain of unknown function (DUF1942)